MQGVGQGFESPHLQPENDLDRGAVQAVYCDSVDECKDIPNLANVVYIKA